MKASRRKLISEQANYLLFLAILWQLVATALAVDVVNYPGNQTDRLSLLAIKGKLVDSPRGVLSSWDQQHHHCAWEGVTCERGNSRVSALDLSSRGLQGTISPYIGNLSFLARIWLFNNSLKGEIPNELGRLSRLVDLQLDNNTLSGEIPKNISSCSNMEKLSVGFNSLEGQLPPKFKALSQLKHLAIHDNHFTGPLFDVIANITSLEAVFAVCNAFTGTIPSSIARMRNLNVLQIGYNQFSGVVPPSIFNLSSLSALDFIGNQLQGQIPHNIGLTLPRISFLSLTRNSFSGSIPNTISNLSSLETLQLDFNQFTGSVPRDLGRLQKLNFLQFDYNYLVDDINLISSLVNCSQLGNLDLSGNNFTGHLPASVANLSTTLTRLAIGVNPISGTIPTGITNLVNLGFFDVGDCELTGTIPSDFGKLQNLVFLTFSSNRFSGVIPSSLGNISQLSRLYLDDNKFQGTVPSSLRACQYMLYVDLWNNQLSGVLPGALFTGSANFVALNFSSNLLQGSLPVEISTQQNLVSFDVSANHFSGVLPSGLSNCRSLMYFNLAGNLFQGNIPPSFSSLSSLKAADFSQNNLSGAIPNYFSRFPLIYLNLSNNDFEGSVPTTGIFANVSVVSLSGNSKLCGGIPGLHLPKCIQQMEGMKRERMSRALKLSIILVCAFLGVLIMSTCLYLACLRKKRNFASSDSVVMEAFFKVSYSMLVKATDGFSTENMLGTGSFGSVFKGILDGETVAVKVLNLQHRGASKSFLAECKALRNIRHRNLLRIITACSSIDFQGNDFKALVYEFMPGGSIEKWLTGDGNLSLLQRLDIAVDVAHAINYLHHECVIPIVHCDLKPSNILLDNDMVAHVGDFGLAKFLVQSQNLNQSSTTGVRGTVGYAAPEYGLGSEASTDGDLYSYGILLLELMTGKRPTDSVFKEEVNLHIYANAALPDQVVQIVDPRMLEEAETIEEVDDMTIKATAERRVECIVSVVRVGVACSNHLPQDRMRITEALNKLQAARDNLINARDRRNTQRNIRAKEEDEEP